MLDPTVTSQIASGLQQGGQGASLSGGRQAELEDAFRSAMGNAAQAAPVSGQIVGGEVRVDSATEVASVNSAHSTGSARIVNATLASDDSNFVIDGLSKLRGVFSSSTQRITELAESDMTNKMDRLVNMQIEVANYSLLVDVSSKIAGKAVQSLDTLMR